MNRLHNLGLLHGTDKATYHKYTEVYLPYFENLVEPTIMEIGVFNGASIKMWTDFFYHKCQIVGVDRGDQLGFQNYFANVEIVKGDQSNRDDLKKAAVGKQFDVIIDDGSHMVEDQQISFATLFPYVKVGGIYIIEDLQTSHPAVAYHYNPGGNTDTITWLEKMKEGAVLPVPCLTIDEVNYISNNVKSVELLYPRGPLIDPKTGSVTSVIRKK